MTKFDDLLVFTRVVERQSFIGAARQLGMPPATVSRKIQELEARLGIQLLRRTTRRLTVTETGQAVYEAAARGVSAIEEAESIARSHHDQPSGVLRITTSYAFGLLGIEPLMQEFMALYPDVKLCLTLSNETLDLVANGFDVAIRLASDNDDAYVRRPLFQGRYLIVGAPSYLAQAGRPRTLADLAQHRLLATGGEHSSHAFTFVNGRQREELTVDAQLSCNEPTIIVSQVVRGGGLAVALEVLCKPHLLSGALEVVLPSWTIEQTPEMALVYTRRATQDSKLKVFVDFMLRKAQTFGATTGEPVYMPFTPTLGLKRPLAAE